MNVDPVENLNQNKELNPRPLLECLDIQSTFQKRKKNKTFERINSSKTSLIYSIQFK